MAVTYYNVPIGPAIVEFGATTPVVFNITKGGVVLNTETSIQAITVDQYGDTPVKQVIKGRKASVRVPFALYDLQKLSKVIPNSELVTDATDQNKKKLIVKGNAGFNMMSIADKLVIKPTDPNATPNDWITIPIAVPDTNIDVTYDSDSERLYVVTFTAFPDADNDDALYILGDETATGA